MSRVKTTFWQLIAEDGELAETITVGQLQAAYKSYMQNPDGLSNKNKGEQK